MGLNWFVSLLKESEKPACLEFSMDCDGNLAL